MKEGHEPAREPRWTVGATWYRYKDRIGTGRVWNAARASKLLQPKDNHRAGLMDAPEDHPIWRQLKLSLERPYKDENGSPEHTVLDITPDGGYIYEP